MALTVKPKTVRMNDGRASTRAPRERPVAQTAPGQTSVARVVETFDRPLSPLESQPNQTMFEATKGLHAAAALRRAGRLANAELMFELGRYRVDAIEERTLAGELAGLGLITAEMFRQISTNSNYNGRGLPLADRLAFALLTKEHGVEYMDGFLDRQPFDRLAEVVGKPLDIEGARRSAAELIDEGAGFDLMKSDALATRLGDELEAGGTQIPFAMRRSTPALLTLRAAVRSGADAEAALALAGEAQRGELDPIAFHALAPSSAVNGRLSFREEFLAHAVVPEVSIDVAADVARRIASNELTFNQLHGFIMRLGGSDDRLAEVFTVEKAVGYIAAMNAGTLTKETLERLLKPDTYLSPSLANGIWDSYFNKRAPTNGGGAYTISGAAPASLYTGPLLARLTVELVTRLAGDPALERKFVEEFQSALSKLLPTPQRSFFLGRVPEATGTEQADFIAVLEQALAQAEASLDN